jgi:hypothetical protein
MHLTASRTFSHGNIISNIIYIHIQSVARDVAADMCRFEEAATILQNTISEAAWKKVSSEDSEAKHKVLRTWLRFSTLIGEVCAAASTLVTLTFTIYMFIWRSWTEYLSSGAHIKSWFNAVQHHLT